MERYLEFVTAMQTSNRNLTIMAGYSVGIILGFVSIRFMPARWRSVATIIYLTVWLVVYIFIPVYFDY